MTSLRHRPHLTLTFLSEAAHQKAYLLTCFTLDISGKNYCGAQVGGEKKNYLKNDDLNGTAIWENGLTFSYKVKHTLIVWPSSSTSEYLPK